MPTETEPSILDGASTTGDPAAYPATPGEFAARWNDATEERRQQLMTHWQHASSEAARCFEMDHDGRIDALHRELEAEREKCRQRGAEVLRLRREVNG